MPLEPMGLRHGLASTICCTQFKKPDWRVMPGSDIHADVVKDRIVHSAAWCYMGKENMCKRMAERGVWRLGWFSLAISPVMIRNNQRR